MNARSSLIVSERSQKLNKMQDSLSKYASFLTNNKWDAEDLVQESVLKALQHYRPSELHAGLLKKIAYNHWIDTVRKRKNEIVGIAEDACEQNDSNQLGNRLDTVKVLVDKLTPKQAIILTLKDGFCYQASEVATILATTDLAVKASLHRARKRLEQTQVKSVDSFWNEQERKLLSDLLYQSLAYDDPTILIDCISKLPSLTDGPKLTPQKHSVSPQALYSMAA
ncbi:sigma-70 family RNA polymerase sigma factor [Radiobacillus sp. PE A8.2]|uniref:sigma-70 family RNA polymerase sigma factor n=1 Tax=Radiobacillus sp. PE A8.2 TaxID=3380349 RepID=UPI00388D0F82